MHTKKDLQASLEQIQYLEKQDSKKTEFFLAASHQLKTPLTIVLWCLQSVMESATLNGKDKEMVSRALSQAQEMSQLITDMLHVFRLVNRKGKSQLYAPVDVTAVMQNVLTQYEVVAAKRHVHIITGPMESVSPVLADESYLKQAVINLIDNALKYSRPESSVTVELREKKGWVEIIVKDQGIGIAEADQHQLFSEFFRTQNAQDFTHEGTGLGLVLVKHIMDELGGEILLDSTINKGSCFTLRLPAAK